MKTPSAAAHSIGIQQISRCFLISALLMGVGCVSQHRYDKTRAEADELIRTLEATRSEMNDLAERIAALQAANRQEDAVATDLRAAIQREQDMLPFRRQRGDDQLAALQTQVAHLVNQSRLLAQKMTNTKQESASLQVMVAQYKQEIEESRLLSVPVETAASTPAQPEPTVTQVVPPVTPADSTVSPQQTAQANPVASMPQTVPPRPVEVDPAPVDDSWIGMITSWLFSMWSWIFD